MALFCGAVVDIPFITTGTFQARWRGHTLATAPTLSEAHTSYINHVSGAALP